MERGGVRACLRLGERVAADFFAARVRQKELLFLFVGAEAVDGIAVEGILHGENHAGGSAAAGNLFDHDGVGDVIEAGATLRFGKSNACEAEFGGFLESRAGKMARLIQFFGERA